MFKPSCFAMFVGVGFHGSVDPRLIKFDPVRGREEDGDGEFNMARHVRTFGSGGYRSLGEIY